MRPREGDESLCRLFSRAAKESRQRLLSPTLGWQFHQRKKKKESKKQSRKEKKKKKKKKSHGGKGKGGGERNHKVEEIR